MVGNHHLTSSKNRIYIGLCQPRRSGRETILLQVIGLQCRYALIIASLNSLAANLPLELLIALVRKNVVSLYLLRVWASPNNSVATFAIYKTRRGGEKLTVNR